MYAREVTAFPHQAGAQVAVPWLDDDEIETFADELRDAHDCHEAPIDVVKIAKRSGIRVRNAKFKRDTVSGLLRYVEEEERWEILVNVTDGRERQRFTVAHELGHFVLHREFNDDFVDAIDNFYRNGPVKKGAPVDRSLEWQANRFAAELLMPRHLVIEAIESTSNTSRLAKLFQVSKTAMDLRLDGLGYR